MKKVILGILCAVFIIVCVVLNSENFKNKSNSENTINNSTQENSQNNQKQEKEGYDIIVSKKEITIEKGKEESFDITFTNPDETSIREYIKCQDNNDIIIVQYSDLIDGKINVDVKGLKAGNTEISVCDYNYPERKEIVKVNVVEAN